MNYRAPWWLPGGNLQTIWAALGARRVFGVQPKFRRERWIAPDGDFVDVDWLDNRAPTLVTACTALPPEGAGLAGGGPAQRPRAPTLVTACTARGLAGRDSPEASSLSPVQARSSGLGAAGSSPSGAGLAGGGPAQRPAGRSAADEQPLLVLFHGLEGSSRSHYAEAFADFAAEHGLAFAVPHFRGCSGEINQGPRAYHSGDHEEIGWILARLRARHSGPLVAAGVSLGGNALMRWAAEAGDGAAQVADAVAAVCSPLDLAASSVAIGRGFNRLTYTAMFLRSMKPKAAGKLKQHPGLFDGDRLMAARDLYQFDDIFTAPLHGFASADDYYARASAKPHLHRIRIPALALNALNDPFVPAASLPKPGEVGDHVTLWQPREGGHVGFPYGRMPAHVRRMPDEVGNWLLSAVSSVTQHPSAAAAPAQTTSR